MESSLTNFELLLNLILIEKEIFIIKLSKFVCVNNCRGSIGCKELNSLQLLSPVTLRSFK